MRNLFFSFLKNFPKLFLAILATGFFIQANAACNNSGDPILIASNCDDLTINNTVSGVTISPPATVAVLFGYEPVVIGSSGNVAGTFLNQGTINTSYGHNGILNRGTISVLTNEGTITNPYTGTGYGAIANNGEIGTLNNSGTIIGTQGTGGGGAYAIYQSGHIGTINNSGLISAQNTAIAFPGYGSASIDSIINSGTIEGGRAGYGNNTYASAIVLGFYNSIGNITNTGTINHSVCDAGGTCYAAIENVGGRIGSITNYGTLTSGNTGDSGYGIINRLFGSIGTLNNAQGAGNSAGPLKYFGILPTNYNVIVIEPPSGTAGGPTVYGQLAVTNASSATNFGIDSGSSLIANKTYQNVVTGVTVANFTGGAAPSGRFGTGAMVTQIPWYLTNSGSNWSLVTQVSPTQSQDPAQPAAPVQSVNPVVPTSGAATNLAQAIASSAAVASNGRSNPVLTNGTTLATAAQNLTVTQANALINAHAEGYSSNMTIGLEQMNNLTNTVMDRIHKPISNSSNTSVSYQVDEGRYAWIDLAGYNGNVRDNNNLAGFGYNQYNAVFGSDIMRNQTGGFGVFGGVGYSNMTNSQQVVQSFNNTTYFTGLYGGLYLPSDMKVSGAAGYVYGNSNVSRTSPTIGNFTGGTASDSYNTNGAFAAVKLAKSFLATENLTLTPFVGASYSQQWTGGINEAGGGDFNYSISNATAYQAVTFAGAEFILPIGKSYGNTPLSVIGSYRYGYNWYANSTSAHTVTANSPIFGSFNQTGANMGPVSNTFGLGLQGHISQDVTVRAGVMAALNTYGNQIGGGAELRVKF